MSSANPKEPIITMSEFPLGRLGNNLFQYASLYGIAKKFDGTLMLPQWEYAKYFDGFFPEAELISKAFTKVKEKTFRYIDFKKGFEQDNLPKPKVGYDFSGYLQSEKYWEGYRGEVKAMLKFNDYFKILARRRMAPEVFEKETIAVCVRRGDYVNHEGYAKIDPLYYYGALKYMPYENCNIIFFSDDIEYCKLHFSCLGSNVYFAEGNSDIEDLCLISQCTYHIIGNSTFHWWGAYLSESKKVIRPDVYFKGEMAARNNTDDFWIDTWFVKNTNITFNLEEVAFIIPFKYDHPDRLRNLTTCLKMLVNDFQTNIIIIEEGGSHAEKWFHQNFQEEAEFNIKFMSSSNGVFHRTKMINEAIKESINKGCEYSAIWDADILISPVQIMMATEAFEKGNYDIVYPYDGRFCRTSEMRSKILKHKDVGIIKKYSLKPKESVGGAIMVRNSSFVDGGMENENFISFGPEDKELFIRFLKLGFSIERIKGPLFHMNHYIGPDSSRNNPKYASNKKELHRILAMTADELREEIAKWPWT